MKSTFIKLATVILIISCKSPHKTKEVNYAGYLDRKFWLTGYDNKYKWNDSLASVSLKISDRLDTFYKWEHRSDCASCGWMKYRFADKRYPQFPESGWMWTFVPDSTYQLSIWHKPIKEAPDSITLQLLSEKDTSYCHYHPHLVGYSKPSDLLLNEFKLINERPFVISAFVNPYGYLTDSQTLFVVAETNLKSRELYFIGECRAKDTVGFIDNIYKSILSIKIAEKQ